MEAMRKTGEDQTAVGGGPERSGGAPPTEGPSAAALGPTGRPEMVAARGVEKAPPDPEVREKPVRCHRRS